MASCTAPETQDDCPICFSELTPEKFPSVIDGCCNHKFCWECLENCVKKGGEQGKTCPMDRKPFNSITVLNRVGGKEITRGYLLRVSYNEQCNFTVIYRLT